MASSQSLSYSLMLEAQDLKKSGSDFELKRSSLPKKSSIFVFAVKALNFF
jgi:hypothetical protein